MSKQEVPDGMVCIDGVRRPWLTVLLPSDASRITSTVHTRVDWLRESVPGYVSFIGSLTKHARNFERHDHPAGSEPDSTKSRAFRNGVYIGSLLVLPLFQQRPPVLRHSLAFVRTDITPSVVAIKGENKHETANLRSDYLLRQGAFGHRFCEEVHGPLTRITDAFEPEITNHMYLKGGAGLGMLAVWEGFRRAEKEQMDQAANTTLDEAAFDAAIQQLLNR